MCLFRSLCLFLMEVASIHNGHNNIEGTSSSSRISTSYNEFSRLTGDPLRSSKKFVPWEPYKAANGKEKNEWNEPPSTIPTLIPYTSNNNEHKEFVLEGNRLVDGRKERLKNNELDEIEELRKENKILECQLIEEKRRGEELRRVMNATMDNDVVEYVKSMSNDKVRLASMIEDYSKKLAIDMDKVESLSIERDIWRAKFLAMAVRADEEGTRASRALSIAIAAQRFLSEISSYLPSPYSTRAIDLSTRSLSHLFSRSPCDDRICRRDPIYSNITITCCSKCAGREIYLL